MMAKEIARRKVVEKRTKIKLKASTASRMVGDDYGGRHQDGLSSVITRDLASWLDRAASTHVHCYLVEDAGSKIYFGFTKNPWSSIWLGQLTSPCKRCFLLEDVVLKHCALYLLICHRRFGGTV